MTEPKDSVNTTAANNGDLIQLVGLRHKSFIFTLEQGKELHTHRGVVKHDDLIGKLWGTQIFSHNGSPFFLLQPSLPDILKNTKRATQIMYPKEIGYILLHMGIIPGTRVIEAGTGSGSFTTALAYYTGENGKVFTYEIKAETQQIARKSIDKLGLSGRVEFKVKDISEGFDETDVDAIFLDVANAYDFMHIVKKSLKPGGYFGCILPTANQVIKLLITLRQNDFAFVDVCDISLKYYKAEPLRFRPADRMIAHTGYLIFARSVSIDRSAFDQNLLDEIGLSVLQQDAHETDIENNDDSTE
jgi:tRNA (adenine57-N1/adenine58-N1)-methyltransferase catalytic subunit